MHRFMVTRPIPHRWCATCSACNYLAVLPEWSMAMYHGFLHWYTHDPMKGGTYAVHHP